MTGRDFRTLKQFAQDFPAFPLGTLRWLRAGVDGRQRRLTDQNGTVREWRVPPNGFARAFVKVGRRVLVDTDEFFEVIKRHNTSDDSVPGR